MAVLQRVWYIYGIDKKNNPGIFELTHTEQVNMTTINDLVLIHLEDAPVSFARVEHIEPDVKKDWYQIKLLMLQVPLQVVTWILKDDYINGDDFFMNGKRMKLVKVEAPVEQPDLVPDTGKLNPEEPSPEDKAVNKKDNVISLSDFKKET